jgi:hypothetical protein
MFPYQLLSMEVLMHVKPLHRSVQHVQRKLFTSVIITIITTVHIQSCVICIHLKVEKNASLSGLGVKM